MSLDWNGAKAEEHIREAAIQYLNRASAIVLTRAKELLSIPGTAQSIRAGHKGETVYGAARSKPGEPPRKQTGRLRAAVASEIDESTLTARVGTNVKYGKYLELGTKRGILPRPWLRRALFESQAQIDSLEGKIT